MRVKKFEAKNMKEALKMVKNELGPDAVILSARENKKSYGIGGEASVEITAAVSESTLQQKKFVESRLTARDREKFASSDARTQRQIIQKMVDGRLSQQEENRRRPITSVSYIDIPDEHVEPSTRRSAALEKARGRNVRELLNDFDQDFDVDQWEQRPAKSIARPAGVSQSPRAAVNAAPVRATAAYAGASARPEQAERAMGVSDSALARIRSAARDAWQAGKETADEEMLRVARARQQQAMADVSARGQGGLEFVTAAAPAVPSPEIASLKGEIERLQKMLEGFQKVPQTFASVHPGGEYGIPYDLSFMFQKLVDAGVTIDHAVEMLLQASKELDQVQMKKRPIVDAWVARYFLSHIQTVSHPSQGRLHLFVGGSGSGKTSSLVKMASHLVVKERKKVAILTTDSYKVGAVDQLKIYCQILNVPFAVIRSRKDWEWVLGQMSNIDHILTDFPGFQLRDLEEIHVLKSLLPPGEVNPVTHLCVAATSKDGDAYEMARRYKVTEFSDLIFTNLDQSVQHGIIYNLHAKTGKPLHSFGIGPRIPEDFEAATKERVLDLIFKLSKLRRESK